MQSILVTGANGFISSHLTPCLVQREWQIIAALRINYCINQAPSFITPVIVGEINSNTDWHYALNSVDAVIHLAGRAHIMQDDNPNAEVEFFDVNVEGTANLVEQSIQAGVKHFVFISSIGAIATQSPHPLSETTPCTPDTPYGQSKYQAEQALIAAAQGSDLSWTILRPPLVYGPGNPGNMARLQRLIQRGLPLPLGAIANQRSFIYVENLVDAIITCLDHPQARNQTFLVSDGQDLSTPELIGKIAHHSGYPCRLLPVPVPLLRAAGTLGDWAERLSDRTLPLNRDVVDKLTSSLTVNSHKIRQQLGWQPPFTVDQGLARTFQAG